MPTYQLTIVLADVEMLGEQWEFLPDQILRLRLISEVYVSPILKIIC